MDVTVTYRLIALFVLLFENADCVNCPEGQFTNGETGAAFCSVCKAGRYRDLRVDQCEDCPIGWYQESAGQFSCLACVAGFHQNEKQKQFCLPCVRKTPMFMLLLLFIISLSTLTFFLCFFLSQPAGKYQPLNGSESCKLCPRNSISKESQSSRCKLCKLGEKSEQGSAKCDSCELGTYGSSKGNCMACPTGQYQDGKGETTCKECGLDTYLNEMGKSSNADCTTCSADRTTGINTGNSKASACLCKRTLFYHNASGDTCADCPEGADCQSKDGITNVELVARNGYWRPHPTSSIFSDCRQGYSGTDRDTLALDRCCPPGKCNNNTHLGDNETMFSDPDEQCKDGYSGNLCLMCADNYVKQGTTCTTCPGGANFMHAFLSMTVLCAVVFLVVFFVFVCAPSRKDTRRGTGIFGQVKIIVSFLQILAAMPGVFDNVSVEMFSNDYDSF